MPPDDPILETESQSAGNSADIGSQSATPQPTPAAPTGVSREEFEGLVQGFRGLSESIKQMTGTLSQRNQPAPSPEPDEEAFAQSFYKEPKATLDRRVQEVTQPIISQAAETVGALLINEQRAKVEAKWGEGAYDKIYAGTLDPVFASLAGNPQMLNRKAIENAFKTVTGENVDALIAHRDATRKAAEESEIKDLDEFRSGLVGELGNLTGGFRSQSKPALNEEQRSILRAMEETSGEKIDHDRILALTNVPVNGLGMSLDQYKAATGKLNGSGKPATKGAN